MGLADRCKTCLLTGGKGLSPFSYPTTCWNCLPSLSPSNKGDFCFRIWSITEKHQEDGLCSVLFNLLRREASSELMYFNTGTAAYATWLPWKNSNLLEGSGENGLVRAGCGRTNLVCSLSAVSTEFRGSGEWAWHAIACHAHSLHDTTPSNGNSVTGRLVLLRK